MALVRESLRASWLPEHGAVNMSYSMAHTCVFLDMMRLAVARMGMTLTGSDPRGTKLDVIELGATVSRGSLRRDHRMGPDMLALTLPLLL